MVHLRRHHGRHPSGATMIGGWEVVWYERKNTTLPITRYQSTAWHNDRARPSSRPR
jgi:hypothetical protein